MAVKLRENLSLSCYVYGCELMVLNAIFCRRRRRSGKMNESVRQRRKRNESLTWHKVD